ncbi:hypothetical protein N7516_005458 [Penicillium verrucosum]|uniref:uncharacterized protein n=1 Tax=Penicillium verrucosum TaxID=60171 RepID=UPI0025459364|nr:uncharacterized protein N7516_005458 [Penicillium verrucosum]KAJ5945290.1 hypothetical protein N7516_005458 [Penicillium verrucosum]
MPEPLAESFPDLLPTRSDGIQKANESHQKRRSARKHQLPCLNLPPLSLSKLLRRDLNRLIPR